jgi:hypothetical protein
MNQRSKTISAPIHLDLAGFTGPELMILATHLFYAAGRLRQELDTLRQTEHQPHFYPPKATRHPNPGPPGLMISTWAGLIRDARYFTALASAVEAVLDDRWGALFIPDRPLPPLDLSGLLTGDHRYFVRFLNRERDRAQLAVAYIQKETFDERVKSDLRLALDVEIRFFTCLLDWLGPLIPVARLEPEPEMDWVPLLFVSLPRVLTTDYPRAAGPLWLGDR